MTGRKPAEGSHLLKPLTATIDLLGLQPVPLGCRHDVPRGRSLVDDKPLLGAGPMSPPNVRLALQSAL